MIKSLLKASLACVAMMASVSAFAADSVIPSGFSVTEPVPGSTVKQISVISFKSTSYTYLTLNPNVKIQINGKDVASVAELSGSAKSIVTYTLSTPVTEAGEYEIVIPQGAVSYSYFGDSNQSGQFKFSVEVIDDSYTPTETTIPSGFTVSPAPDSEVESISEITVNTTYMDMAAPASGKIKVDGNEVDVNIEVSGSFKDVLKITPVEAITAGGEHTVLIPAGLFTYNTWSADNIKNELFFFTLTVPGEGKDEPLPETPVIPNNFSISPAAGSEVEAISEIVVESMLYEGMEVYAGKSIIVDGNQIAVSGKKLDNWGSELEIKLANPVTTNGVHSVVIPAGTFKYSQMFGAASDNTEFRFTLIVANGDSDQPQKPTIITQQPEGTLNTYDRSGSYYYNYDGYLRTGAQTGTIDIVFADNNKVYLKDPVNNVPVGSWVEGTLNDAGTTITVKLGQYLYEDPEYGFVTLEMVEYDDDYEWFEPIDAEEVTYSVDGDKISLNGTYRKGKCLGVVWASYNEWAGNADYGTVYVPVVDVEQVVVPDGIEISTYIFKGNGYGDSALEYTVNVGFDENDMYIQGIFTDTPKAWIKGTVEGNNVTFRSPQYLGKASYGNRGDLYMVAVALENTIDIIDLVLTYDEEAQAYVNNTQYLVLNTSKSTVYMVEAISNFSISKVVTQATYPVPYHESFGTEASLNDYTVIDANHDNNTWYFSGGKMSYSYSPNAADDWLITPAIELEAGKSYAFTLQARSFASLYPERFEVKLGAAPTAEAMTAAVIEPTQVASDTMAPFTGKVKVETSGNYHFGIHAISDPDQFDLMVDDISVTEAEDDGVMGITRLDASDDSTVYSLDGRVVNSEGKTEGLHPGIYIKGGRKIIVR